jgi:hypothetical protein
MLRDVDRDVYAGRRDVHPGGRLAVMEETPTIAVTLNVHAHDESSAARVVEALSRPLAGFAFEGLYASLSIQKIDNDDEADDEERR